MLAFDPGDLDLGDLDHWESGAIQFSENEGGGFRKFIPMPSSTSDPRKKMDPSAVSALPFAMFNFWIENDLPPPLELILKFIRFGTLTRPKAY